MKTLVSLGGAGTLRLVDTVEIDGRKWLVPEWIDTPAMQATRPARIILLDDQLLQWMGGANGADWLLTQPIPRPVFDGVQKPTQGTFDVILEPEWPPTGG